jgi:hypothetical protein
MRNKPKHPLKMKVSPVVSELLKTIGATTSASGMPSRFIHTILYFLYTPNFGFKKTVCPQHGHGSFITSSTTALLTSVASAKVDLFEKIGITY